MPTRSAHCSASWNSTIASVQRPASCSVQPRLLCSGHEPPLGPLVVDRGGVFQGAPGPGLGVGGVGDGEHVQRIHGQEFLAQMVREFGGLLEERHGHLGVAAGVQHPAAFQQHPDGDGGFVAVDRVQQRVGFLVPALQPDGPAQLGGKLGPFVGVVAVLGRCRPEAGFRKGGVIEVP